MLVEKDVQQILNQLIEGNLIKIPFEGSNVMVRIVDQSSKLCLTASVFEGGNYIPGSVRSCLFHQYPFSRPSVRTYLTLDEEHFQVKLNYLGHAQDLDHHQFKELLEEFGVIAEQWRYYLEEHGKNDLIYIHSTSK
ncbi:MAG: hypothetical protein ACH350_05305 [Parachlamydiaceae bacterium]